MLHLNVHLIKNLEIYQKFQIHRKSSSNMYFQEYDIKSTSFKETHNKIIWSYTKTGGNANSKLYDKWFRDSIDKEFKFIYF